MAHCVRRQSGVILAVLGLILATAPPAHASLVLSVTEVGSDVVVSGSGSANLAGLTLLFTDDISAAIDPVFPLANLGQTGLVSADFYLGLNGPVSFGPGSVTVASTGTGDRFGLNFFNRLIVPAGYVSGTPLSASNTYTGATIASLGATPGNYMWTWGSGGNADSLTLIVNEPTVAAVPEPASLTLLGLGLAGLSARRWRQRRR